MSLCRSTPELLPCPACGNNERMKLSAVHSCGAQIVCDMCRLRGPFIRGGKYEDEEIDAAIAWNNLPRNTAQPPEEKWSAGELMSLARIARTLEMIKESQVDNDLPVSMKMVEEMAKTARDAHEWKALSESSKAIVDGCIATSARVQEENKKLIERLAEKEFGIKTILEQMKSIAQLQERLRAFEGQAIKDVANERARQITEEGWTPEHDDNHIGSQLAAAAACYAVGSNEIEYQGLQIWPLNWVFKPASGRRNLVKAAALLVAEIERLDR